MLALLVAVVVSQAPSSSAVAPATERWPEKLPARFVGALVGGAALAASTAIPAGLTAGTTCPFPGFCPIGAGTIMLTVLTPVASLTGASVGSAFFGGSAPVGAGIAGLTGGLTAGAVVLLLAVLANPPSFLGPTSSIPSWPVLVGASALALGLQTLAMDAREDALEAHPELAVPAGRFALETVANVLTIVTGGFLTVLMASASAFLGAALTIGLAGALLAVAPLVPWAIHRAMDGRGGLGAAYLGWLGSLGIAALGTLGTVLGVNGLGTDPRGVGLAVFSMSAAVMAGSFGVPLALEYGHGLAVLNDLEGPSVSVAPIRGGALGSVALRF